MSSSPEGSPKERITDVLHFIDSRSNIMRWVAAAQRNEQDFWPGIADDIAAALREQPTCALEKFTLDDQDGFLMPKKPLMHLVCQLKCPLSIVELVYNAAGQECLEIFAGGRLPLHEACINNASVEVIRYLVQRYPKSTKIKYDDKLPLKYALTRRNLEPHFEATIDPFDEKSECLTLFGLLSELLDPTEVLAATNTLQLSWSGRLPMDLGLILKIATLHHCNSILVILNFGHSDLHIRIVGCSLVFNVACIDEYYSALEQISFIPLPIKSIEATGLNDRDAIYYFTEALDPPQENIEFNSNHPNLHPPQPLDLSSLEILSIDATIQSNETLLKLAKSLRRFPRLNCLHLGGRNTSFEGYGNAFTPEFFEELSKVATRHIQLQTLTMSWVDKSVASPFINFCLACDGLEKVVYTGRETLDANQVAQFARFLQASKTIKSLTLGPLRDGAEHILNAIKDNGSVLQEFWGDGEYNYDHACVNDYKHSKSIATCLAINKIIPKLSRLSMKSEEAFNLYQPHLHNVPILYALLRHRPELWCGAYR